MQRIGMREKSIKRMDEIITFYSNLQGVLAIAAFGSNAHRERLDDYSDLDFLIFVDEDSKAGILSQVARLESLCSIQGLQIVYGDAVQLLFADGVYCDFGIITPSQLSAFPHGAGKYLWQRLDWEAVDLSAQEPAPLPEDALIRDALFHLYCGLLREARGETAAAFYEVQVVASQRVLALLEGDGADAFSPFRRAERLLPQGVIGELMPGYGHTREAVQAMLRHLSPAQSTPLYQAVSSLLGS